MFCDGVDCQVIVIASAVEQLMCNIDVDFVYCLLLYSCTAIFCSGFTDLTVVWRWRASMKGAINAPSFRSSVVNEEMIRPGHWLESVITVFFSTLTLWVG